MRVAVIGAGMAGLSCAMHLLLEGMDVTVFEQYERAGGRLRSITEPNFQCDLGASYFTATDEEFSSLLQEWQEDRLLNEWHGWLVELHNGQAMTRDDETIRRFVGTPNMDNITGAFADVCDVEYNTQVQKLSRESGRWVLWNNANERLGVFDAVVTATPPAVAMRLLAVSPKLAAQMTSVDMQPSWTVVLGFSEPLSVGFDAAHLVDSPITWLSNNNSKPDRSGLSVWVLQAGNEWSIEHLDKSVEWVSEQLHQAFAEAINMSLPPPDIQHAHLWQESLCVNPLKTGALWHDKLKLGACGDWCQAARVEGAFISGRAMAQRVSEQRG